jgi:hypothetical protein
MKTKHLWVAMLILASTAAHMCRAQSADSQSLLGVRETPSSVTRKDRDGIRLEVRTFHTLRPGHIRWEAKLIVLDDSATGVASIRDLSFHIREGSQRLLSTDARQDGQTASGIIDTVTPEDLNLQATFKVIYQPKTGRFGALVNMLQRRGTEIEDSLSTKLSRPLTAYGAD